MVRHIFQLARRQNSQCNTTNVKYGTFRYDTVVVESRLNINPHYGSVSRSYLQLSFFTDEARGFNASTVHAILLPEIDAQDIQLI